MKRWYWKWLGWMRCQYQKNRRLVECWMLITELTCKEGRNKEGCWSPMPMITMMFECLLLLWMQKLSGTIVNLEKQPAFCRQSTASFSKDVGSVHNKPFLNAMKILYMIVTIMVWPFRNRVYAQWWQWQCLDHTTRVAEVHWTEWSLYQCVHCSLDAMFYMYLQYI